MSDKKIILETERLVLREYCQEDFPRLSAILTDAETMKYYEKPYDENGVQRWLDWSFDNYKKHGFGLWAIELKETGPSVCRSPGRFPALHTMLPEAPGNREQSQIASAGIPA